MDFWLLEVVYTVSVLSASVITCKHNILSPVPFAPRVVLF